MGKNYSILPIFMIKNIYYQLYATQQSLEAYGYFGSSIFRDAIMKEKNKVSACKRAFNLLKCADNSTNIKKI